MRAYGFGRCAKGSIADDRIVRVAINIQHRGKTILIPTPDTFCAIRPPTCLVSVRSSLLPILPLDGDHVFIRKTGNPSALLINAQPERNRIRGFAFSAHSAGLPTAWRSRYYPKRIIPPTW